MSFCPIEDAFQDPFLDRIKQNRKSKRNNNHNNNHYNNHNHNNNHNSNYNNNNNDVIENFECLNGQDKLKISNEYKYKHMLSRSHPEEVNLNVNLNNSTQQLKRPDEQSYYPDMSLENEYALMTDVKHNKGKAYRPPHPFTQQANPSDVREINGNMYESFNETDNLMAIDSDSIRNQLLTPQELVSANNNNKMIYGKQQDSEHSDHAQQDSNLSDLLENQKALESKLDQVLNRLNKLEVESDGKENIHDIILFGIFGIFFIYILDSVYKIGKKTL